MTYPTGEQFEIVSGEHRAVVTEVGATLRSYTVDGRAVVRGFEADEVVTKGRGQQLLPWPNRPGTTPSTVSSATSPGPWWSRSRTRSRRRSASTPSRAGRASSRRGS